MKQQRMKLKIVPSTEMDGWATSNPDEHEKIRLSKVARKFYQPSNWKTVKLLISGASSRKRLAIGQAPVRELKLFEKSGGTKNVGFVTTQTYKELMVGDDQENIWISETAESVTIGADPEFVLVKENGDAEYAKLAMPGRSKLDDLGHDGPCAEIRPEPAKTVEGLIENIRKILTDKNRTDLIKDYEWIGGASYKTPNMDRRYPIGGHVHFGLPKIPNHTWKENDSDSCIMQRKVVRVLDELVALPSVRIDTPYPGERRKNYGWFGDMREGSYKMEYRVLSGLWLTHPELAKIILATSKAIVEEVWKRLAEKNHNLSFMLKEELTDSFGCMDSEALRLLINKAVKSDVSKEKVKNVYSTLKNMTTYHEYRDEIDEFISICLTGASPDPTKLNIKKNWL